MPRFVKTALVALPLLLAAMPAQAAYRPGHDITISVTAAPSLLRTSGATGYLTYSLQEGAHTTVTSLTGQSVDHSYIWVNVNGQPVAAIDPLCGYDVR